MTKPARRDGAEAARRRRFSSYKFVLVIGVIVAAGCVHYIWMAKRQTDIRQIGYEITSLSESTFKAKNINAMLRAQLEQLHQPERVKQRLHECRIVLTPPRVEDVVWLKLPAGAEEQPLAVDARQKPLGTLTLSTRGGR